jgi:glycine dehydrogenase subunit 2
MDKLLFNRSVAGRRGSAFPTDEIAGLNLDDLLPPSHQRTHPAELPEISENEVIRHYTALSRKSYGVDTGYYPLGSCTMKYNPKIHEEVAQLPGFAQLHPMQPEETAQGALGLLFELQNDLAEIAGMSGVSLQPAAGAQGEFVGMLMARAYFKDRGENRRTVIIPDSAHGTNPSSAALAGFNIQTVRSNKDGRVDLDDLAREVNSDTAVLMLTNPNTLGLFEREIRQIAKIVHDAGGLMYMDGANLNALLGLTRPGDMGFDICHFNLHKTFSTPHGGGGPGAGPVGVTEALLPYLPSPQVAKDERGYFWDEDRPKSVGRVHGFFGNFGILVRAYTYIRRLGAVGLSAISRNAILNANYLRTKLSPHYPVAFDRPCMHEFVITTKSFRGKDVHAWDVAKRLIDYGFYPPTINFPHIVEEALMIETPESEPREALDAFVEAMRAIRQEIENDPQIVINAPHTTPTGRMNETLAARNLDVRYDG